MNSDEFGSADGNVQLENYCSQFRLGQPKVVIQKSSYGDSYEAVLKVGTRQVICRAQELDGLEEKVALRWLKVHGSDNSSLAARCASSKPPVQMVADPSNKLPEDKGDGLLDHEASDEEGQPDPNDFQKYLLGEVFGSSPSPNVQKKVKKDEEIKKKEKSRGGHSQQTSDKNKFFKVFTQNLSCQVSPRNSEKRFKFSKTNCYPTGRNFENDIKPSSAKSPKKISQLQLGSINVSTKDKIKKDDDIHCLLDSSGTDSETFQKFEKKAREKNSSESESDTAEEAFWGGMKESQIQTNSRDGSLFDALKKKFKWTGSKKKESINKINNNRIKIRKFQVPEQVKVFSSDEDSDHDHSKGRQKESVMERRQSPGQNRGHLSSVDELLKLPETVGDSSKTMDEILDEVDEEIKAEQAKHEEEMIKLDRNLEELRARKKERKKRFAHNAILKRKLVLELTRPVLSDLFSRNLSYLDNIKAGRTSSDRHMAFHTNPGTRQALLYRMISNPFTDDQVDWTYEEMTRVWMRTSKEYHDNNDYIWKVLMPECLIKLYMDFFNMPKEEAEVRIRETPLDEEKSD